MKKTILFILILMSIFGCQKKELPIEHFGKPFICAGLNDPLELEKNQNIYIRRRIPVRVRGVIKYHDAVLGHWAFLRTTTSLIYVDFSSVSANITLPKRKISKELIIEGHMISDETVLNGYALIPYAYEIATRNILN